jgi:hypothetical protein
VASGVISWEQAGVLVRSLEALPQDLDAELVAKAEAHLIAEAGHFGPREVARLGLRVLEVVAPTWPTLPRRELWRMRNAGLVG